jgi:predicted HAD superfamily Cof-like phosphohydrolase
MLEAEQQPPDRYKQMSPETITLRKNLVSEEHAEFQFALSQYKTEAREFGEAGALASAILAKECADLLVVTYGTLAAMGLDGDQIMRMVMDNNDAKLEHRLTQPDGKLITPPAIKAQLKDEIHTSLCKLFA